MPLLASVATIRPAVPDELNFVFDSWLNSWRTNRWAGVVRNCDFYETTRTAIEDLIGRGAKIVVAEWKGELLGWACAEEKEGKTVLHYRYVKDPYRRQGLESQLLQALPGTPGFFTFYDADLAKDRAWRHTPEIARRIKL